MRTHLAVQPQIRHARAHRSAYRQGHPLMHQKAHGFAHHVPQSRCKSALRARLVLRPAHWWPALSTAKPSLSNPELCMPVAKRPERPHPRPVPDRAVWSAPWRSPTHLARYGLTQRRYRFRLYPHPIVSPSLVPMPRATAPPPTAPHLQQQGQDR